jgi:hypothetical protein
MTEHTNDPLLAEAIARRDESRAQILRARAVRTGETAADRMAAAFEKMAKQAEKDASASSAAFAGIEPVPVDKAGTAPTLSDSKGNFAPNPDVANVGGIGAEASNTKAGSTDQAQKPEDVDLSGVTQGVGPDGEIGGETVEIPADWEASHWQTRVALAKRISGRDDLNTEQANEIIKAEVGRRNG